MPYIDWMGKDDVVNHHKNIAYKTIECKEEIGDKDSENMIIKGDNLLALKSLLPYYASSVKMIYIDPPYNTGNTSWIYNDNMDSPLIKKWLNDTVNADDLSRSDKWLCMMYPRLKLLRELLKDDGVIFISIDNAEVTHLKMICDEIFGIDNFVTDSIWRSSDNSNNDAKQFSSDYNHTLVYSKKSGWSPNKIFDSSKSTHYKNPDNNPKGAYFDGNPLNSPSPRENLTFDILSPNGTIIKPPKNGWRWSKETIEEKIKTGEIRFTKDEQRIKRRTYLSDLKGLPPSNLWIDLNLTGHNRQAKYELLNLFPENIFATPKPIKLLKFLLKISTQKDDIILDSFAGSGTTAHAVLEQNREDGGNRKFILIETLDYAKDITAERVKRVIKGYDFTGKDKTTLYEKKLTTTQILKPETMEKISKEVNKIVEDEKPNYDEIKKTFKENVLKVEATKSIKSFKEGIGGGFKYCELSEDIFDEFGELNSKLTFEQIAKHIYFVEFKKPIDKATIKAPFVGTYKQKYLYFYKDRFLKRDMQKLIKECMKYEEIVVYTSRTSISDDELNDNKITIRYIPYDIKDN